MMVTGSPGDDGDTMATGPLITESLHLGPLVRTVDVKGVPLEDKVDAYLTLTERLKGDEQQVLSREICRFTYQLTQLFSRDVMHSSPELSQAALQALGFCVYHTDISRSFTDTDASTLITALCNALLKTDDKSTCTRALWCLSKQNFTKKVITAQLHTILCAVEHALTSKQYQSMTVEHEGVNVIIKLLEQSYNDMPKYASRWSKLVYPLVVHSAHKIRERAAFALQIGLDALQEHRAEVIPSLIPDLKAALVPEMVKLFAARQELHVLKIWSYFVKILGKALHKGGSLINCLLGVVEQGFKHPSPQVKKLSFNAWSSLIDNFAMDPDILYNAKRLKVLMQPLKATSAKTQDVAESKVVTWWYLCQELGPRLASNFDLVCVPLLEFTLGIQCSSDSQLSPGPTTNGTIGTPRTPQHRLVAAAMASPATPRLNLPPVTPGRKQHIFPSMQCKGVEILARLLGKPPVSTIVSCTLAQEPLPQDLISGPTVFMKLAPTLIRVVKDVILLCSRQICNDIDIKEDTLLYIWTSLVAHIKNMVQVVSKRDSVGIFNDFLRCLQCIVGAWPHIDGNFLLKLVEIVSKNIPMKVLGSPSYHSSCAGAMHGTPALVLIKMLFANHMGVTITDERFFCVYETFIEAGMSTPSTILGFAQSVVEMLGVAAATISKTNTEALWRLWNRLVQPLLEHVIQSNEVNQGDSLDHHFGAMYRCLEFPAQWLIGNSLSQGTSKTLLRTWFDLYQAFARCAALVTTAQSNQCCEDLASNLLVIIANLEKNAKVGDACIHMCQVMVDNLDFAAFTLIHGPDQSTPSKWNKKKRRPLGNLHSIVKLLSHVLSDIHDLHNSKFTSFTGMFAQVSNKSYSGVNAAVSSAMNTAISVVNTLFSHTSQPGLIACMMSRLAKPLAIFYTRLAKLGSSTHLYSTQVQQKLEKLWIDITTCIQSRYAGPYDNDFLATMSPLLETTFLHPKRTIKDHTLLFWNTTFATVSDSLEYPEPLRVVLNRLKEKTPIKLPGWSQSDNVIDETPMSQLIQSETSQSIMGPPAGVIPNFGSPSPRKVHGSFLKRSAQAERLVASSPDRNRGRSPSRFSSPARFSSPERGHLQSPNRKTPSRTDSPNVAAARRKLPVDEDSMQFVTIAPSPTKKRVLTEHQKDVLRTRKDVIPGLYNDLEQSQDTQAFADLYSQTQTQMGIDSDVSNGQNVPNETEPPKDVPSADNESSPKRKILSTPTKPSLPIEPSSVFNLKGSEKEQIQEPSVKKIMLDNENMQEQRGKSPKPRRVKLTQVKEVNDTLGSPFRRSRSRTQQSEDNEPKEGVSMDTVTTLTGDEKDAVTSKTESDCEKMEITDPAQPQESSRHDVEESKTVSVSPALMTPPKKSNSTTENLAAQEVTPPKSLQSPIERKVMITPVIKLQKMSVMEILRYSPTARDSTFAKLDVDSSPKVFSSKKDKEKGRAEFKRHDSQDIRSSPRLKRSQERSSSFDDMIAVESDEMVSRGQDVKKSLLGKQQSLLTSQADLAELAERFELDGIEPLEDEADVQPSGKEADADTPTESTCEKKSTDTDLSKGSGDDIMLNDDSMKQRTNSEESMDFLDSQEELIPVLDNTIETETESEYATAYEMECDVSKPMEKKADVADKSDLDIISGESVTVVANGEPQIDEGNVLNDVVDLVSQEPVNDVTESSEDSESLVTGKKRGRSKSVIAKDSAKGDETKQCSKRSSDSITDDGKMTDENIDDSSKSTHKTICDGIEGSQKKGRGRPRKIQRKNEEPNDESVVESQPNDQSINEASASKRKRGRPKKNIRSKKDGSSNMKSSSSSPTECKEDCHDEAKTTNQDGRKDAACKKSSLKITKSTVEVVEDDKQNTDSETKKDVNCDLENSCEDMFGSYDPDATRNISHEKKLENEEDSVAVVEVKASSRKLKKRRSFTKLSRKKNQSPCTTWDQDDDVPLAAISHSYLDVESQSSEESDTVPKTISVSNKSSSKIDTDNTSRNNLVADKEHSPVIRKRRKRKIKKSPQAVVAKRVLRKALKSPLKLKASPSRVSPLKKRNSTPKLSKNRSPVATRMRAGKLTPKSARQLLAGKKEMSPEDFAKVKKVKEEGVSPGKEPVSDDSFDLPLNVYIKQSRSPVATRSSSKDKPQRVQDEKATSKEDSTTREKKVGKKLEETKEVTSQNEEEASNSFNESVLTGEDEIEERVNSSQTPDKVTEVVSKTAEATEPMDELDPKVGQSLQTLPHRLQFVTLTGRNSPTECSTPENTSPVVPHKFSPRSCSSPVEFAMRRGSQGSPRSRGGQGSPRQSHGSPQQSHGSPRQSHGSPTQRFSPLVCDIPGVFSPSVSPSSGILKRQDSPSPSNKSRRVSFAEPVEQERSNPPSPLASRTTPVTSSPSRCSTPAALMPSPLVTSTSSRVVSLQSKFITTPSKRSSSTSKLKSVTSAERRKRQYSKQQSLKVMNTRMLFSRGARAILASKGAKSAENGGKKMTAQEQFKIAALDSMTRGLPVRLSPSPSPTSSGNSAPSPTPSTQDTQALLTQGTQNGELDSSMEGVDFESQEPVFPDLASCDVPVEKVLHQLTSSMWVRGLGQLIRARNILTIGHLCSLSPGQVKSLPIKSPKVSSLCQVMERFKKRQIAKLGKDTSTSGTVLEKSMPTKASTSATTTADKDIATPTDLSTKAQDVPTDQQQVVSETLPQESVKDNPDTDLDKAAQDLSDEISSNEIAKISTDTDPVETVQDNRDVDSTEAVQDNLHVDSTKAVQIDTDLDSSKSVQDNIDVNFAKESALDDNLDVIEESQPFSVSHLEMPSGSNGERIMTPRSKPPLRSSQALKDVDGKDGMSTDSEDEVINDNNNLVSRPGKRKRDNQEEDESVMSSPSRSDGTGCKRRRMVDQLGELAKELSGDSLHTMPTDKLFQAHQHVNDLMDSIMAALKTKCRSPSLDSSGQ